MLYLEAVSKLKKVASFLRRQAARPVTSSTVEAIDLAGMVKAAGGAEVGASEAGESIGVEEGVAVVGMEVGDSMEVEVVNVMAQSVRALMNAAGSPGEPWGSRSLG